MMEYVAVSPIALFFRHTTGIVTMTRLVDSCQHINKISSYIAQYPVLRTVQSALHFTSLADLFTQTPSRIL